MSFHIGCGVVLSQDDKYVLVQEVEEFKKGLFNLPAGTLKIDEDLVTCAIRETEEEAGIKVKLEHFVGVYQTVLDNGNNVILFVFAAKSKSGYKFHSEEHAVIKVLPYEEIESLAGSGQLRSEIVIKAIKDYRSGQKLPLSTVQSWHLDALTAVASLSRGPDSA